MDFNVSYSINTYQSFGSALLSEETRRKLISLGIDPSTVTSESQAKILIAKAEGTYEASNIESPKIAENKFVSTSSEAELMNKARELSKKMGLNHSKDLSLDEILTVIAKEIEKVLNSDVDEKTKEEYLTYNAELSRIKDGYSVTKNNEKAVLLSMTYNAEINRMILGL